MTDLLWFVAHTRPRCEKKLAGYCEREELLSTLPLYKSVRKYRGKTCVFEKPLFPGYVFLQIEPGHRQKVFNTDFIANLLDVPDQIEFAEQLAVILAALESGAEIYLVPEIGAGDRVRIKSGVLRGTEGWVEQRYGMTTVLLRLDFIGQAAGLKVQAHELERL